MAPLSIGYFRANHVSRTAAAGNVTWRFTTRRDQVIQGIASARNPDDRVIELLWIENDEVI
jgi:hypothetical protein